MNTNVTKILHFVHEQTRNRLRYQHHPDDNDEIDVNVWLNKAWTAWVGQWGEGVSCVFHFEQHDSANLLKTKLMHVFLR